MLTAAAWGGDDVHDIHVVKTLELMSLLDPDVCDRVIYFARQACWVVIISPLKKQERSAAITFALNMFAIRG